VNLQQGNIIACSSSCCFVYFSVITFQLKVVTSKPKTSKKMGEGEERRSSRPRFLRVMIERRNKKRAPSYDATIDSSSSSIDPSHHHTPPNSLGNPSRSSPAAAIVAIEEEGTLPPRSNVPAYKSGVALSNRFAALQLQQQLLGEHHPDVLFSLQNLATLHYRRGDKVQAQRLLEDYQGRRERALSDQHGSLKIPSEIFCTEPM
jgi:hypothetical protein